MIQHPSLKRRKQIARREFKITGALIFSLVQIRSPSTLNRCKNLGAIAIIMQGIFLQMNVFNQRPITFLNKEKSGFEKL